MRFTQRWLQGGKTEPLYVEMYNRAMDEMIAKLVKKTRPSGLEVRSLAQSVTCHVCCHNVVHPQSPPFLCITEAHLCVNTSA